MKNKQYRQGDVLLTETNEKPTGEKQDGKIILAHGEVTGHHHTVECDKADWWKSDGDQFVVIKSKATVTHQEHAPIILRNRTHKVRRQSEYSPEAIRRVAD